jgi:hypothetical protein
MKFVTCPYNLTASYPTHFDLEDGGNIFPWNAITTQKATISTISALEIWEKKYAYTIPTKNLFTHSLGMHWWRWILLLQMISDLFFLPGTNSAVRLHSKRGAEVYYYLFDYRGTNSFSTLAMNSTVDYGKCSQCAKHANIYSILQPIPVSWIVFRIKEPGWLHEHARTQTHNRSRTWSQNLLLPCAGMGRKYITSKQNGYGLDDRGSIPSTVWNSS